MSQEPSIRYRDIVVIGCSAGGVQALPRIVEELPVDFPAAVVIVQHISASHRPYLVEILTRATRLPVSWAEQGAPIERGKVYVAPPDVHLLFADDHFALNRGAKENHSRPAIDRTFRSAAASHGSRTIGVLMTGMLDDGVSGLIAIRAAGGVVIVQDPLDAEFPELPANALKALVPDRVLRLDEIASTLRALAGQQVPMQPIPTDVAMEAALDRLPKSTPDDLAKLGPQTSLACPECDGPLWELGDRQHRRYRCYLGHVVTSRTLLDRSDVEVESALWSAVRSLTERATMLETLARDTEATNQAQTAAEYAQRAREARRHADLAHQFMLEITQPK